MAPLLLVISTAPVLLGTAPAAAVMLALMPVPVKPLTGINVPPFNGRYGASGNNSLTPPDVPMNVLTGSAARAAASSPSANAVGTAVAEEPLRLILISAAIVCY